jgi:guanylate kinase
MSGPSGVGKDAVLTGMKKAGSPFYFAVTMTTRTQRVGEEDGVDYRFVSKAEFEQTVQDGGLLEWANVYGNLYGVPKTGIQEAMAGGQDAIVKIDVQGAATIKRSHPEAVFVFLAPPSMSELEKRLRQRKTDFGVDLALRLEAAKKEMKSLGMFDYVVVNHEDGVDSAISQIECVVTAEKCRVKQRSVEL